MRRTARIIAIVFVCSVVIAAADSAKSLYKKGVDAEARQDIEAAYTFYKQAYELKPTELKYRVPYERTRFLAAASKVHRGQKLREQGQLIEALALFQQAAAIDPSNDLAAQEIRRTQALIQKQQTPQQAPAQPKEEDVLRKRLESSRAPVMLNDINNAPLSALEFTSSDTKTIYETIGKLAGINVLFDPDYQARTISIKLRNVTLQEALDIVSLQSRTFWRPVTPNTIFVAADTATKRRELEQNVIKTFYLGNVSTATDLQDIVNALRTVLEVQRIQQIPSQNAIILKGNPDQLALAQKMVDDIDKARPEVIIDVWVAQVRRDKQRNLGIIPPQSATVTLQGAGVSSTGTGTTATNPLTFDSIQKLNLSSYALTIAPLQAVALLTDDNSQILQNPRLRASDNEKASLKIGDKIPIATGSFGTPLGVGTAAGAVGVNTQFTYTEVGVTLEITPHVHPDGQVTLKTTVEISNTTTSSTIGGITQPIISQRKAEQTIRMNDGEINLMGGILEQTEDISVNGTPFLGSIPLLRYFFSSVSKHKVTNEIVFILVPHIVRSQELTDLNRRAIDVGMSSGLDLHIAARPMPATPAATPGPGSSAQPGAPAQPVAPGIAAPATRPAPAPPAAPTPTPAPSAPPQAGVLPPSGVPPQSGVNETPQPAVATPSPQAANPPAPNSPPGNQLSVRLDPANTAQGQGNTFSLNVVLANGQDISTVPLDIAYDSKVLQFVSVTPGDFLNRDGQPVTLVHRDDPAGGRLQVSSQRPPGSAGVSGGGTVFRLLFLAKTKGAGTVSIATPGARNGQGQTVTSQAAQATVTVN